MKNKLLIITIAIITSLIGYTNIAQAYNNGLLQNKQPISSLTSGGSAANVTDNSLSTSVYLKAGDFVKYDLGANYDITSAYWSVSETPYSEIWFYDSSNVQIGWFQGPNGTTKEPAIGTIRNVRYVQVVNFSTAIQGKNRTIYEIDVYGTKSALIPTTPTNLTVTGTNGSGTLNWATSTSATSYKIFDGATQIGTSTTTSYTFNNINVGTHNFSIVATNTAGNSAHSSSVSYTYSNYNIGIIKAGAGSGTVTGG